jgi:GntR family transcriptional regulator/MocR family aminotransferase
MIKTDQPINVDASDLPLSVPLESSSPRYLQLAEQLQRLIESRYLPSQSRLPSTRALARSLGINRNTVVAAFEQLAMTGQVETHGRGGTVVRLLPADSVPKQPSYVGSALKPQTTSGVIDFRLGSADPSPLPIKVWRRACREAGRHLPGAGYGDPKGDENLRAQIALYLGRTRALRVEPEQVLVTSGAGQAIERIAQLMLRPRDHAAVEDPGYPRAAEIFRRLGARLVPIPVDENGLSMDFLLRRRQPPQLLHITPSHQYPLGSRLSSARRHALVEWARDQGSLIVENDYDGEFRYGSPPLPALASVGGLDHIVYVGTFSKVLSPAVRLGFIAAHVTLVDAIAELIGRARDSISIVPQRIMSWMIRSGELEKHIRRTRRQYASRRNTLLSALSGIPEVAVVSGQSAGLHVVVELRQDRSRRGQHESLQRKGLVADRVSDFQLVERDDKRLLMAYGHLSETEILQGIRRLAELLHAP